jgi:transposase
MKFVAALDHDAITALFVIDRAMTSAIFLEYIRQCLTADPGAGRHRCHGQSAGAQEPWGAPAHRGPRAPSCATCRPTRPIEQGFSKLKAHLRKAQKRSIDALWQRIGKLLDLFQPAECANFFANSGYALAVCRRGVAESPAASGSNLT